VERIVNKAKSFKEADKWDRRRQAMMTPQERIRAVRVLRRRVFGKPKAIKDGCREIATKNKKMETAVSAVPPHRACLCVARRQADPPVDEINGRGRPSPAE
jgi:hypothetical protein